MSFEKYINTVSGNFKKAIKVEWLNPDESVNFEFTNSLYDINVDLSVNYQNGSRRACTLTLNNDRNKFPINFNNIWFGQKFKLWMGIYIDDKTPYYFPQGVFYVSNPNEVYQPSTRTIKINGVDKWAFLDGTLYGKLHGTYQTNINNDLFAATRSLLRLSRFDNSFNETDDITKMIDPISPFIYPALLNKTTYVLNNNSTYDNSKTYYSYDKKSNAYKEYSYTTSTWDSNYNTLYTKVEVWKCPYTAKVERGKTYADVLLEYATILCAHIYYDVNGRLVIEPMIDTADDITDTNKEIVWHYTVEEKTFLGLTQTYNFDKVYNDIIVLGNITNGYQFKARVQNRNLMSDTCVQKIGLKTKEPFEDNQYYSDDQCKELALYYAKVDTILQKSGDIASTPLYHLDVNKIVSVSTPNNNMSKELFLITGFSLNSSDTMSVNVTSVNVLKDFSVVEVDTYE